ncbi:hypothetical protein EJB05_06553, partial [Eragrostis curvula]
MPNKGPSQHFRVVPSDGEAIHGGGLPWRRARHRSLSRNHPPSPQVLAPWPVIGNLNLIRQLPHRSGPRARGAVRAAHVPPVRLRPRRGSSVGGSRRTSTSAPRRCAPCCAPGEFRPDRFVGSGVDVKGQDFELLPFGSGHRMCPGIGLRLKMVQLTLANLVHAFAWRLPDGVSAEEVSMEEEFALSMLRLEYLQQGILNQGPYFHFRGRHEKIGA